MPKRSSAGGRWPFVCSHGVDPENPKETLRRETLPPDQTPLAAALEQCGLDLQTQDLTRQDHALAQRKQAILAESKSKF